MSLSRRELLYAGALIPLTSALPALAGKPVDDGPTGQALAREIGTLFVVRDASGPDHLLRLESLTPFTCASDTSGRTVSEGFSAVFTSESAPLEQAVYDFQHDRVAPFSALTVPIASKSGTPRYEVVFNRMVRA